MRKHKIVVPIRLVLLRAIFTCLLILEGQGVAHAECALTVGVGTNLSTTQWPSSGTICINPGDYTQALVVQGITATSASRLTFQATNSSTPPNLRGGVLIRNSSFITLTQVNASNPGQLAAVLVDQGSHDVTIDKVSAQNSQFGIVIGAQAMNGLGGPAGSNNVVQNNGVGTNIDYSGIAVMGGSGGILPKGQYATVVYKNVVSGNGGHGIDIDSSSNVKIEGNQVKTNGYSDGYGRGGYSGIHLYGGLDDGRCGRHSVRFNYVWDTKSVPGVAGTDGNGIQLDHFCDENEVAFNVVWNNAGAGIAIFASAKNLVYSNTVANNTQQPNRATVFPPSWNAVGEIVLSTCDTLNAAGYSACGDQTAHPNRTYANVLFNNIARSTIYGVPAINVNSTASSNSLGNKLGPNLYWVGNSQNSGPSANWAPIYYGGPTTLHDQSGVDSLTGTTGNRVEYPWSLNEQYPQPLSAGGKDGYRLTQMPGGVGKVLDPAVFRDMCLHAPTPSSSFFGAYFYNMPASGDVCNP